jgi:hypothetical protein
MMEHLSQNRLIRELLKESEVSEEGLKKIYRTLCKKTHPDITGKNSEEFKNLQKEYKEAIRYVSEYEELSDEKVSKPRIHLYKALKSYLAYGLFSSRIRNKTSLRQRNESLLKEIINLSNLYSKEFMNIFIEYNRVHIKKLNEWDLEKKIRKAKNIFLNGLNCFLDYEGGGNIMSYRACKSYLGDCIYELKIIGTGQSQKMLLDFSMWILKEIELPPAKFW